MNIYNIVLIRKHGTETICESLLEFKSKGSAEKVIDLLESLRSDMVVEYRAGIFKGRTDR